MKVNILRIVYLIPIIGIIVAIIWLTIDFEYVNEELDSKYTFYVGMISHVLIGAIISLILLLPLFSK